jgi:hypothetical protein
MSCANKIKGGSGGASGFGSCVYGNNPQSVGAVGGNQNNAIVMNSKCGQMLGGKRKSRRLRKSRLGGSVFGDIAIPAAFLYANTYYKPKRGKSKGRRYSMRRSRRSRR